MEINLSNEIGIKGTGPKTVGKAAAGQKPETGDFSSFLSAIIKNPEFSNGMTPVLAEGAVAVNGNGAQDAQPAGPGTEAEKAKSALTDEAAFSNNGEDENIDQGESVTENGIAGLVHMLNAEGTKVFVPELTPANVPAHANEMHARAVESGPVAAARVQTDGISDGQEAAPRKSPAAAPAEVAGMGEGEVSEKDFELSAGILKKKAEPFGSALPEKAVKEAAPEANAHGKTEKSLAQMSAELEKTEKSRVQATEVNTGHLLSITNNGVENKNQTSNDNGAEHKANGMVFQPVQYSSGSLGKESSFEEQSGQNDQSGDSGAAVEGQTPPAASASFREIINATPSANSATNPKIREIAPEVHEKLQSGVRVSMERGGGEVKMKLHPESLGELTIKLNVEGGSVKAEITVNSHAVKAAIDADSGALKEALGNHGLSLDKCVVEVSRNETKAPDAKQGFSDSRDEQWTGRRSGQEDSWQQYKKGNGRQKENLQDGIDFFV